MNDVSMVEKEARPDRYYRQSPGQVCTRCGGDNSFRAKGTKYCYKCSKEVSAENAAKRREYIEGLKKRDMPNINECCKAYLEKNFIFCPNCGQRMKRSKI